MNTRFSALSRVFFLMLAMMFIVNTSFAQKRYRVGYKDEGFTLLTEATLLIPSGSMYRFGYNTQIAGGVAAGKWVFAGGAGMDVYKSDFFVTPFATGRYFFSSEQLSPFFLVDAGYSLPIDADPAIGSGPSVTPGLGLRYFASRAVGVNLAVVYRYHSMPLDLELVDASTSLRTNFVHGIGFRIGMQF